MSRVRCGNWIAAPAPQLPDARWETVFMRVATPTARITTLAPQSVTTVAAISTNDAWCGLASEWPGLFASSPTAAPALDWDWLRTWWDIYGHGRAALRVLTVRRAGQLIGALPLYGAASWLGLRRLRFLSTGENSIEATHAEYLDLLHVPGQARACLDALREWLEAERSSWDELEFGPLAANSPLLSWRSQGFSGCRAWTRAADVCPIADLENGFESYLQRLSANSRQQARRLLRALQPNGAVFTLAADSAEADQLFAELIQLHQERWQALGLPGSFAAPRFTAFHQALARAWVPNGKAVLARLSLAGQTAAVLYGFIVRDKFDFYQSGVKADPGGPLRSAGVAAHLLLMRLLSERGIRRYDFLGGVCSYKERLSTDEQPLVRLHVRRATPRAALAGGSEYIQRAARRGCRLLMRCLQPRGKSSRAARNVQ
jgi:CelD/BcsL family acetyltransferase involved in cellulose biosynthesis